MQRREFLLKSGLAAGFFAVGAATRTGASPPKPSDRVVCAVIGTGGRAQGLTAWALEHKAVELATLCDVSQNRLDTAAKRVREHSGKEPATFRDFRRVLERKDIDRATSKKPKPPFIKKANLLREVDDLAGVRLLHLHTRQMAEIDPAIKAILDQSNYKIQEGPKVYIWDIENKDFFDSIGIEPIEHSEMYTSVHYVVSSAERPEMRIELQVRTLMEEVWGEVSHTVDYPEPSEILACREQLKVLARLTSGCSRLVDSIFAVYDEAAEQTDD